MGFKREFHGPSLEMGRPLMERIKTLDPDMIACDCLSCRMQFSYNLSLPVVHPVELLREAYQDS